MVLMRLIAPYRRHRSRRHPDFGPLRVQGRGGHADWTAAQGCITIIAGLGLPFDCARAKNRPASQPETLKRVRFGPPPTSGVQGIASAYMQLPDGPSLPDVRTTQVVVSDGLDLEASGAFAGSLMISSVDRWSAYMRCARGGFIVACAARRRLSLSPEPVP
jgi:hypothetical protein